METTNQNATMNRNYTYIRQIMTDMKNGVMALDKKGKVIYSNPQMNAFFEQDLANESVHTLMCDHGDPVNDVFWDTVLDVIHGHEIHYQKKLNYVAPSGKNYSFHMISSYLHGEADGIVITVSDETQYDTLLRKKHDTAVVLVGMLLLVCATVLIAELHEFLEGAFPHDWIARTTEYAGLAFMIISLKFTSLSIKDFGILSDNVWKELKEAFLVLILMVLAMSGAKKILLLGGSDLFPAGRPFFDFTAPPEFYYVKYIGIVIMQEVLTKCCLQKSINRVIEIEHANTIAILITSIMFMALHVQHGLVYMVGAGLLSAVLAILYNRHDGLLGCSLVHYTFGITGLVLGWIK